MCQLPIRQELNYFARCHFGSEAWEALWGLQQGEWAGGRGSWKKTVFKKKQVIQRVKSPSNKWSSWERGLGICRLDIRV